jgi:hypothetical protein
MRFAAILFVCLCCVGLVPLAAQDDTLTVDATTDLGVISPLAFGANFGPLSVVSAEMLDEAQSSGIRFLRYPGGRWGDQNNITEQQVDVYINLCRQLNVEPSIHVRLENGTPEQAAELLRYANIENDYNIRYWYIGNEPSLFDNYTTVLHNQQWRAIAEAMLEVDPDIILIGPDVHQYYGDPALNLRDPEGREWVDEFLMANGDLVDIVSIHRYPFPVSTQRLTTIDELRGNPVEWERIIPYLRERIQTLTGRDIPIAVTEVNSHWSGQVFAEASPDSHYNAIWYADVFGRLLRQQVALIAYFELQTPTSRGGWGLLGSYEVHPTYYTYQLYQRFGQTMLASQSSDDLVTVYAARREDGVLTLIVVNLADDEQRRTLSLQGFTSDAAAEVYRLSPELNAERLEDVTLADGTELTLPGQSVTLYIIPVGTGQ